MGKTWHLLPALNLLSNINLNGEETIFCARCSAHHLGTFKLTTVVLVDRVMRLSAAVVLDGVCLEMSSHLQLNTQNRNFYRVICLLLLIEILSHHCRTYQPTFLLHSAGIWIPSSTLLPRSSSTNDVEVTSNS
jgi:hypothetical protein